MTIGASTLLVALLACACAAEKWRWPESTSSVRIDTKVHFIDAKPEDDHKQNRSSETQSDEPQFEEPANTEGFYNRPPGVGRYPVHVEMHRAPYRVDSNSIYDLRNPQHYSDGTLDSLQYCKCVSSPECHPNIDSTKACGVGKFLCCYKRPNKNSQQISEIFNEVDDERPFLLPGQGEHAGPFPPPPSTVLGGSYGSAHNHEAAVLGAAIGPANNKKPVLVGPGGPTGLIGPAQNHAGSHNPAGNYNPGQSNQGLLVGPDGPTGIIGPNRGVLVGPEGPTGITGPNRGVLTGPGGPTGIVGPRPNKEDFYLPSFDAQKAEESAQRGILVGPGGPTGIIGPAGYGRRPVLVGPGGPTGIIGPYGNVGRTPVLVGPGGPTGMIGPPRRFYGK
ncbi:unnamed protein product [Diatraea saccharalis]|uniref:Uncharacterized protein n=1 Tax=Diatraea saccharalis TaxID=40085 RepID=A0A9N9R1I2_9NEOP|nr:unnamed protein product [Diatraea saccharalis]